VRVRRNFFAIRGVARNQQALSGYRDFFCYSPRAAPGLFSPAYMEAGFSVASQARRGLSGCVVVLPFLVVLGVS